MNPIAWTGPEFIRLYLGLAFVVLAACWLRTRVFGGGPAVALTELTADPYRIAYLRGGERETIRIAIFNLVDRGFLAYDADALSATRKDGAEFVRRPLDRALLEACALGREVDSLIKSAQAKAGCAPYREELRKKGLVADEAEWYSRINFGLTVVGVLLGVAVLKIVYSLAVGRVNVLFLLMVGVTVPILVLALLGTEKTASGRRALGNIQGLMKRLKASASRLKQGGETNEALLLAAVFGLQALPAANFPALKRLFPRRQSSDSGSDGGSSSLCSSSSGCGGGGGCGGCGGD